MGKGDWRKGNGKEFQDLLDSLRETVQSFRKRAWYSLADEGGKIHMLTRMDPAAFRTLVRSGRFSPAGGGDLGFVSEIRCPVLAVWGEEDTFLPPVKSAENLKKALDEAGHRDFRIRIFPGATHFLTPSSKTREFTPGYIEEVSSWIKERYNSG